MGFGLNILTAFQNRFGNRKVRSSYDSTHLPNISAHRKPRVVGRIRSARLHAAKSAAKLQKHRSIQTRMHRPADRKPLRRCDAVLIHQRPTHPQPPGAFVVEPSFVVPGFPELDDRHLPPFAALKLFFDALVEARQALLRAEKERKERKDAEYAHLLEQEAHAARRRAEDAEFARLLEEFLRKAEAARRREEDEEFARLLEEDKRKFDRRAKEQEEKQRQAEREATERENRERERREKERREREVAQSDLSTRLRAYEEKWAALRSNAVGVEHLGFHDIPWPSFENVRCIGDITEERVSVFMCHLLHEHIQCPGGGQAKSIRSELLLWHPDKFVGHIEKVIEGDRKAVWEAVGHLACILTTLCRKMH